MAKQEFVHVEGEVVETLPNLEFRVQLDGEEGSDQPGKVILTYLRGKMRRYSIRILPGDRVKVELDPKYPEKGRIVYRFK
jgi:translation initiation factor IF-1